MKFAISQDQAIALLVQDIVDEFPDLFPDGTHKLDYRIGWPTEPDGSIILELIPVGVLN